MTSSDAMWARLSLSAEIDPTQLHDKKLLLIGAGGLGNDLAIRLAALNIAQLTLVDGDTVSTSNLPHSTLFLPSHVGLPKVHVIASFLAAKFPQLTLKPLPSFVQQVSPKLFADHDLIICAPDNDQTRRWVNHYAVKYGKPALFLGVSGMKNAEWTGYTFLFRPNATACFHCFAAGGHTDESFATVADTDDIEAARNKCGGDNVPMPMLAPVVGVMASYAATLALQLLADADEPPTYSYIDLKKPSLMTMPIKAIPTCAICGEQEEFEISAEWLDNLGSDAS